MDTEKSASSTVALKDDKPSPAEEARSVVEFLLAAESPSPSLLESVGDLCRTDEPRDVFGDTEGVITKLVSCLDTTHEPLVNKFAARALGNLCFNHDENRTRVLASGGIEKLVSLLASDDGDVACMAAGTVSNLSYAADEVRAAVLAASAVDRYLQLLAHERPDVQQRAAHGLTNLAEDDSVRSQLSSPDSMSILYKLFKSPQTELAVVEQCLALFESMAETEEGVQLLIQNKLVEELMAHLELKDSPSRKQVEQFLAEFTDEDDRRNSFQHLVPVFYANRTHPDPVVQQASLRLLSALCLSDENLELIYPHHVELIEMIKAQEEIRVLLPCVMILGNMLGGAERCTELVAAGLLDVLIPLVGHEDARIPHLALGGIRNLCVVAEYKPIIVEKLGWKPIIASLENKNAHVIYAAIALLKSLVLGGEDICIGLMDAGVANALVDVCERTLMEGQERLRYEAARVLGVLSQTKRFHDQLLNARAVPCLVQLLEPNFVITRVEALAALGNLAGSSPAACEAVLEAGTQDKLNELCKFDKRPEVQKALQAIQSIITPSVDEGEEVLE